MSQGTSCVCDESKKPVGERNWRVVDRNCNHSAFNGYHHTWSAYSAVRCQRCGAHWRTKAKFVDHLKDQKS